MTNLELAADLEAKHKALVEADNVYTAEHFRILIRQACFDNLPALLTALRESGEAIERAAKVARDEFNRLKSLERGEDVEILEIRKAVNNIENGILALANSTHSKMELVRALKPEPPR